MGANGCGKSTLIDCILGSNRIARGSISVAANPVSSLKPQQLARLISYVPQVHEQTFPYTVREVVMMGRTAHQGVFGSSTEEDEEIVSEALETCRMTRFADRPYTRLSGGEMQMVLLARALAQKAPFIVMDEPTAHLDFKNELSFLEAVAELVSGSHVGVLMATHSPNHAFFFESHGIATDCALMDKGRILATGAPTDVLTEESLDGFFQVCAKIALVDVGGNRTMRQIVPYETKRG